VLLPTLTQRIWRSTHLLSEMVCTLWPCLFDMARLHAMHHVTTNCLIRSYTVPAVNPRIVPARPRLSAGATRLARSLFIESRRHYVRRPAGFVPVLKISCFRKRITDSLLAMLEQLHLSREERESPRVPKPRISAGSIARLPLLQTWLPI
jgi:hypothetical protein